MKALLSRFNRRTREGADRRDSHKGPPHLPLPDWPPRANAGTPTSIASNKPLPPIDASAGPPPPPPAHDPIIPSQLRESPTATSSATHGGDESPPQPLTPIDSPTTARSTMNNSPRAGTIRGLDSFEGPNKKVAFISPPPTPAPGPEPGLVASTTSVHMSSGGGVPLPVDPTASTTSVVAPLKTVTSRASTQHAKDPRGSTSTNGSASRTEVGSNSKASSSTAKVSSTARATTSPYPGKSYGDVASIPPSVRSNTPYSQMSGYSSQILAVTSWSEAAEEDLVSNLGPRERTRQEVLWEIVASEERYVAELQKMKETFIDPLLHPFSKSPLASPQFDYEEYPRAESPLEQLDRLPIAARFLSPTGFRSDTPAAEAHPNMDGESLSEDEDDRGNGRSNGSPSKDKLSHPRSPYRTAVTTTTTRTASRAATATPGIAFPSRSHQSLPPPLRGNPAAASTASLGRQSFAEQAPRISERNNSAGTSNASRVFRKAKKSNPSAEAAQAAANSGISPHQLPEDLRKCLEAIEATILEGHIALGKGLRKRYDEQYPLVRSLADVFVAHSHILHGYATYVLHLERALEQVDNALSTAAAQKKPRKSNADDWLRFCTFLQKLEVTAAEKGETGIAISLSKSFQRLLKYPLLFQNLLYHTDPSTFEYESTLQMVAEVETIVRSIEDEKIQKEERDRTRDVFARIEGLDKVRQLALPKPSRVLVEERQLMAVSTVSAGTAPPPPSAAANGQKGVKGKTSFKRLSDVLQNTGGVGGKKDLWLVVFNDVVLRCQRTGQTSLPLVAATTTRVNSLPDLQGKSKYATTGRRHSQAKPRNLYKFIKIETWDIANMVAPRQGVVSMEDVARTRQQITSGVQPRIVPMPDDDSDRENDSDGSDTKSKMSFSYWGADKVTLQKPVKPRAPPAGASGVSGVTLRKAPSAQPSYGRESSANAKFGTRLVAEAPQMGHRAPSRRTQATPSGRRPAQSDDGHAVRATVTRPAWNASRGTLNATPQPQPTAKRPRNSSQPTPNAVRATSTSTSTTTKPPMTSLAPSEDSGVGLYRQIIAKDPQMNDI